VGGCVPASRSISVVIGTPSPRPPGSVETATLYTRPLLPKTSSVSTLRQGNTPYSASPALKASAAGSTSWPLSARTQPFRLTTTVTGSSTTFTSATARRSSWIRVRRSSPKALASASISLDHGALERRRAGQDLFQLRLLVRSSVQLLLDLDRLQPGQLAQPDLEDVLGLAVAQAEALDQRRLGLVGVADDADHLVDVQQHQLPAFEHVDAVQHLVQAMRVRRATVAWRNSIHSTSTWRRLFCTGLPSRPTMVRFSGRCFPGWCAPAAW
jgi:hypothetical protein